MKLPVIGVRNEDPREDEGGQPVPIDCAPNDATFCGGSMVYGNRHEFYLHVLLGTEPVGTSRRAGYHLPIPGNLDRMAGVRPKRHKAFGHTQYLSDISFRKHV